jgi:hypothetical protein
MILFFFAVVVVIGGCEIVGSGLNPSCKPISREDVYVNNIDR